MIEVFVRQNLVTQLRAVLPANDGFADFAFQKGLNVFVILHVMAVPIFDVPEAQIVDEGFLAGGMVFGFESL